MNIKENVKEGHKERIKEVKEWRRTTYVNMAEETGISIAIFRQIASGNLNISVKTATILSKTYAGLNMNWLLTGDGTMLSESELGKVSSYDGWSAEQLVVLIKRQEELIATLNEALSAQKLTIESLQTRLEIQKEEVAQDALKSIMTKNIISDPVEK